LPKPQLHAIEEFTQQSSADELHAIIGELLANYRAQLENLNQPLTEEEEELIMNLSTAYLKKQQEWLMEGRQEGRQEGIEEGEQRGIEQSRQETAIAALREGLAPELVARITGLSIAAIEKLHEDLA
jgi:predicted transposase/invertase (TIGR01784 family)